MRRKPNFLLVALLIAGAAIPAALAVRALRRPPAEAPHTHGGDPETEARIDNVQGPERLAVLREIGADPLPARRLAAAEALHDTPGGDALPIARTLLADNDSEVRIKALDFLALHATVADRPLLRAALRDDDAWVRVAAIRWASVYAGRKGSNAGPWLLPDLIACLDDPETQVQHFATVALRRLTKQPWQLSSRLSPAQSAARIDRWKAWWRTQPQAATAQQPLANLTLRTDPGPTVAWRTLDGAPIAPATSGKVTVVNFWGTWCGPCQLEVPELQKLATQVAGRDVDIVGVALSEPDGATGVRRWCREKNVTFAQSLGEEDVLAAYGDIHEVPVTVLLDRQGRVRYRWQGERELPTFLSAVERLLAEPR
jgi:thiol-disulfide isomerase/thioredoxin